MTKAVMQHYEGNGAQWDILVAGLPDAHLLQTWEWAQVKAAYGWQPMPLIWAAAGESRSGPEPHGYHAGEILGAAMLLKRPVLSRGFARRLCILYSPKGPLADRGNSMLRDQMLVDLERLARRESALLLKIDPDVQLGTGFGEDAQVPEGAAGDGWVQALRSRGWRFSDSQVQFRNTVWIDLHGGDEQLLGRMKQKARYNIRLAERKGVTVRQGGAGDFRPLYRMYAETADRDGFVIRDEDYYYKVWNAFLGSPQAASQPAAEVLLAEVEGDVVAGLFLFYFARRAYYLYGMSRSDHREKMPNHLLQWEAIRRARAAGCMVYDLWGAPDVFSGDDRMWGVFRFKEGLGGEVVRTIGAWDFPSGGMWYLLYSKIAPRALTLMRSRGRRRVHDSLGAV